MCPLQLFEDDLLCFLHAPQSVARRHKWGSIQFFQNQRNWDLFSSVSQTRVKKGMATWHCSRKQSTLGIHETIKRSCNKPKYCHPLHLWSCEGGYGTGQEILARQVNSLKYDGMTCVKKKYLLTFVSMDRGGAKISAKLICELIAHSLCWAEDDDSSSRWLGSQDL